ncbi:hypothetical protein BDV29DRAFT_104852 [Aspergillus leporis]|uniref:Uncharacterized protein n=1 Tax=Aspergillus leporis TaxID=41062 RepID=A0A5N5X8P7_9EURO|nr:hypothetical protein BDV29DRAFT_104852 [Aspergillus leporis]
MTVNYAARFHFMLIRYLGLPDLFITLLATFLPPSNPIGCLHFRSRLSVNTRTRSVEDCGLQVLDLSSELPEICSAAANIESLWPPMKSHSSTDDKSKAQSCGSVGSIFHPEAETPFPTCIHLLCMRWTGYQRS